MQRLIRRGTFDFIREKTERKRWWYNTTSKRIHFSYIVDVRFGLTANISFFSQVCILLLLSFARRINQRRRANNVDPWPHEVTLKHLLGQFCTRIPFTLPLSHNHTYSRKK